MARLFTYILPFDDGAAPNPFYGMCTLAICKPRIRSVAQAGDWVAGFGSKNAPSGNLSGKLVYAMEVTRVVTMEEYDRLALTWWPHRIPNVRSQHLASKLGDCIYDYSTGTARQRKGVHGKGNEETDLSGKNVLISDKFVYFGRDAIEINPALAQICPLHRGHRSSANNPHVGNFIDWITEIFVKQGSGQLGWPDKTLGCDMEGTCAPCEERRTDGESDDEITIPS